MKRILTSAVLAMAIVIASIGILAPPAKAQSLSISGTASSISATGATVIGTLTATNLVNGTTNTADVFILYGHTDAGTLTANWANKIDLGNSFTNNMVYTNGFLNFTPSGIVFFRAGAVDLSGTVVLQSASGIFTNSALASTEFVFREQLRNELSTNQPPPTLAASNIFEAASGTNWQFRVISNDWQTISWNGTASATSRTYQTTGAK
jgi:hypothetical protein